MRRNEIGRYELGDVELSSGDALDVEINGQWLAGRVEFVHGRGYVFLAPGVCEDLRESLTARLPQPSRPRFIPG